MREVAITFEDVWKSYPSYFHVCSGVKGFLFNLLKAVKELRARRSALEGLSFEIYKGENFGFIGHNGAGKSTTLGLIAGVLSPDKGRIQVNDRVSPLLELGAGFHPELSGRANILLNGVLLGLTQKEVLAHEQQIIDFAGLGEFIDMPVRTYSSGMYAKLGFAVVANLKPKILLLDEILAVGDINFQHKCKAVFERFRHDPDITTVLVSHSLGQVRDFCDRAAWIEDKTIKMIGPATEVVKAYEEANERNVRVTSAKKTTCIAPVNVDLDCSELDCSGSPAMFFPCVKTSPPEIRLRISLFQHAAEAPQYQWLIQPQKVSLGFANGTFSLCLVADEGALSPVEGTAPTGPLNPGQPVTLQIQAELDAIPQGPAVWIPVSATNDAKLLWEKTRKHFWDSAGYDISINDRRDGRTVRVVAKSLTNSDAVGKLFIDVASALQQKDIPVQLYAFSFSRELTGIVSPFAALEMELTHEDILFCHLSATDPLFFELTELIKNMSIVSAQIMASECSEQKGTDPSEGVAK